MPMGLFLVFFLVGFDHLFDGCWTPVDGFKHLLAMLCLCCFFLGTSRPFTMRWLAFLNKRNQLSPQPAWLGQVDLHSSSEFEVGCLVLRWALGELGAKRRCWSMFFRVKPWCKTGGRKNLRCQGVETREIWSKLNKALKTWCQTKAWCSHKN